MDNGPQLPLRTAPGAGTDRPVPGPVPVPDAGTEDGPAVLAPAGTPVRSSAAARAGTALGRHARGLWLDPGRLLHSLYHGRPRSMAGHIADTRSLGWVPPEMAGRQRAFIAWSGIACRLTVGLLLKNLGNGISAAADYPLAMAGIIAFAVILIVLL